MRFYVLPKAEDKTTYINFDHVSRVSVTATTIEVYFTGLETPIIVPKNASTLSTMGKGMDLSDSSKEQLSNS